MGRFWCRRGQTASGTILVEPRREDAGGVRIWTARSAGWWRGRWRRAPGVTSTVAEIGLGLNGSRSKLERLLSDRSDATIVIEHRDRLARFGVEYVEAALQAQ